MSKFWKAVGVGLLVGGACVTICVVGIGSLILFNEMFGGAGGMIAWAVFWLTVVSGFSGCMYYHNVEDEDGSEV